MLVVCITSTEKLGSQLAIRDPVRQMHGFLNLAVTQSPSVLGHVSSTLTIKVEEVIVLVDMWSGIWGSSNWANVVLQTPTLLRASCLAPIPTNIQGFPTCGTRRVLLKPRAQTRAGETHIHTLSKSPVWKLDMYLRGQDKFSTSRIYAGHLTEALNVYQRAHSNKHSNKQTVLQKLRTAVQSSLHFTM